MVSQTCVSTMDTMLWTKYPRIARVSKPKLKLVFSDFGQNAGPGWLPLDSDRRDIQFAGVLEVSVAVSLVCKVIFWNLAEKNKVVASKTGICDWLVVRMRYLQLNGDTMGNLHCTILSNWGVTSNPVRCIRIYWHSVAMSVFGPRAPNTPSLPYYLRSCPP